MSSPNKQTRNIALVTGGFSGESVISYRSASTMMQHLDLEKWIGYLIDIRQDGWWFVDASGNRSLVDKNDFSIQFQGNKITFDAVLVGLHGTPGEDGKLQGYFDCLGIPYTSCDAATSALTFNKRYTVAVAAFAGISVASSVHLFRSTSEENATALVQGKLSLPLFVKPNNGGSSIGMSKVNTWEELVPALRKAFKEDEQVLVEEFVQGREFTIGVFRHQGAIKTLPMTEVISKNEFFDFEAKYEGKSLEVTPAAVEEEKAAKIRAAAATIYEVFHCRGVVRIDFIFHEALNQPFMLEINTVPGQSEASIVPQQVRAMGWTLKDFYSALLEECLCDFKNKKH